MAKSRKLEQVLAVVAELKEHPTSEAAIATLRQVLQSKYSVAVAQAARLVGEGEIHSLTSDLVAAFARFMVKPTETDQGCLAKLGIAEALYRLNAGEEALFLQGIRHVQMEPVWGGREDTAAALRGICALGLVRMNYADVMAELADLLADAQPTARAAAAKAIAYSENPQGVPLLRLKVQVGDAAPQVLSECFTALLQLAPAQSVALVATFLAGAEEQVSEMAALALGETRLPEAFPLLKDWWQKTRGAELRQTGLLAIAMLRREEAMEFLLSLVVEGKIADAKAAIAALRIYQQDEGLWQRVCQAAQERGEPGWLDARD
jgi:HEAT repeat protein